MQVRRVITRSLERVNKIPKTAGNSLIIMLIVYGGLLTRMPA